MKFINKKLLLLIGTLGTLIISTALYAHHSTAGFDTEKVVKIEGTITKFRWTNPHASIRLEGVASDAPDGMWTIEMTAPNILINSGWKRSSLKAGDEVTIFANPTMSGRTLRDNSQGGLYVGAILADGTTLGRVDGAE